MRRLGSPQFPIDFFRRLRSNFADDVSILVARYDGKAIGGAFLLEWGAVTMIWTPLSDRAAWKLKPNQLVYSYFRGSTSSHS